MAVNNLVKRLQNVMRQDAGISGDAQRIEQMTWLFFLKVYDAQEDEWEFKSNGAFHSVEIPEGTQIVVTHQDLAARAKKSAPNARLITISNFMSAPEYDQLAEELRA